MLDFEGTLCSAAEIRVALVRVGRCGDATFRRAEALLQRLCTVPLAELRRHYPDPAACPFTRLPWATGALRLRLEPGCARASVGAELRAHRVVWGVLGVADATGGADAGADSMPSLAPLREAFAAAAAAYPRAAAASCLALGASDAQAAALQPDLPGRTRFVVLPSADDAALAPLVATMLRDFAATLLAALAARAAALAHASQPPLSAAWEPLAGADASQTPRPGRALKAAADVCLLAGSPEDAVQRYTLALEALEADGDELWGAAARAGAAAAALLTPAAAGACAPREDAQAASGDLAARVAADLTVAADGYAAFGASAAPGRAAAAALALEVRLQLARLHAARREMPAAATALATVLAGAEAADVPLSAAERAALLAAAADVAGQLGQRRRRGLLLFRAARLADATAGADGPARAMRLLSSIVPPVGMTASPPAALAVDTPPPHPRRSSNSASGAAPKLPPHPLAHWRGLQRGVLWGCLTAATRGADAPAAWAVAARLLREHAAELSPAMQAGLVRALEAAAALLPPGDAAPEHPPPLAALLTLRPPAASAALVSSAGMNDAGGGHGSASGSDADGSATRAPRRSVFVFSPFERSRAAAAAAVAAARAPPWVAGEPGAADVAVCNPCAVPLRLESLTLEAEDGTVMEGHASGPLLLEPHARGVLVTLRATPHTAGPLRLCGVRCAAFGVTWHVPWTPPPGRKGARAALPAAALEVRVLPPLPLLTARLAAAPPPPPPPPTEASASAFWPASPPVTPPSSPPASPPASPARDARPRRLSVGGGTPASPGGAPTPPRRTHGSASRVKRSRSGLFGASASAAGTPTHATPQAQTAPAPPLSLSLLEGQCTDLLLRLSNGGPVRAARAALHVERAAVPAPLPRTASAAALEAEASRVDVAVAALAAALPLPAGGRAALPVRVTAAGAAAAPAQFKLRCVYHGDELPVTTAGGSEEPAAAREACASLRIATTPGLRAVCASVRPLLRSGGDAADGAATSLHGAVALLELHVTNASSVELRVAGDAADAGCGDDSAAATWEAVPPGSALRLLLPARCLDLPAGASSVDAAAALATQLRVRWRGPSGAAGSLHGLAGVLAGALDAAALAALVPPALHLSATIAPLKGDADVAGCLRAGQLARVELMLRHRVIAAAPPPARLAVALAVHGVDGARAGADAVMWAGSLAAEAEVDAAGAYSLSHAVTLLFLAPGRYTLLADGVAHAIDTPHDAPPAAAAQAALHVHVLAADVGGSPV